MKKFLTLLMTVFLLFSVSIILSDELDIGNSIQTSINQSTPVLQPSAFAEFSICQRTDIQNFVSDVELVALTEELFHPIFLNNYKGLYISKTLHDKNFT